LLHLSFAYAGDAPALIPYLLNGYSTPIVSENHRSFGKITMDFCDIDQKLQIHVADS
jgi:hypothetical protein